VVVLPVDPNPCSGAKSPVEIPLVRGKGATVPFTFSASPIAFTAASKLGWTLVNQLPWATLDPIHADDNTAGMKFRSIHGAKSNRAILGITFLDPMDAGIPNPPRYILLVVGCFMVKQKSSSGTSINRKVSKNESDLDHGTLYGIDCVTVQVSSCVLIVIVAKLICRVIVFT
jgi:hypothetical protein